MVEVGDVVMAEHLARTALERCNSFSNPIIEMIANRALGIVLRDAGRVTESRSYLSEFVALAKSTVHKILRADAHEEMAILERLEGNGEAAEFHKEKALYVFEQMRLSRHCERFLTRFERVATANSRA